MLNRRRTICLASAAVALAAAPGHAQVNPFRDSLPFMQSSDYRLLSAAAEAVYAAPEPRVGSSRAWRNEATGNSGVVKLLGVYAWRDLPCRRLEHVIQPGNQRDPAVLHIDRCRTPSGEWKTRIPD
jgi:hypothetical protein